MKVKAVVHGDNISDMETTVNAVLAQLESEGAEIASVHCIKPMLTVVMYQPLTILPA